MTIQWAARPQLERCALVAAFQGWNDAGNAATDAVRWLINRFSATPVAALDAEEYLDFQAARPTVELVNGVVRAIEWPSLTFASARVGDRDLLLMLGVEPNLRWRSFCADVVGVARETGCEIAVTLGALLGDLPHTRPVRCTGSATDEVLAARLGMQRSRYEGPTGIVGVLHDRFRQEGFSSASIWAPVPHYVATPPNPKATRALLGRLGQLLDVAFDLTDLDIAAAAWERQVAEVVAGDSDVSSYVSGLESRYDAAADAPFVEDDEDEFDDDDDDEDWFDEDDLPSGDALAADIEQYLRDQDDDD
ncbi:MAG: PAC2 family protein [Actinomycetota bacterium]|nr:PAC2 family protein [Actinomycetota bacterium]